MHAMGRASSHETLLHLPSRELIATHSPGTLPRMASARARSVSLSAAVLSDVPGAPPGVAREPVAVVTSGERPRLRGSPGAHDQIVPCARAGVSQSGLIQFQPHLHTTAVLLSLPSRPGRTVFNRDSPMTAALRERSRFAASQRNAQTVHRVRLQSAVVLVSQAGRGGAHGRGLDAGRGELLVAVGGAARHKVTVQGPVHELAVVNAAEATVLGVTVRGDDGAALRRRRQLPHRRLEPGTHVLPAQPRDESGMEMQPLCRRSSPKRVRKPLLIWP